MANITNIKLDSLTIILINLSTLITVVSIIALIAANSASNTSSSASSFLLSSSSLINWTATASACAFLYAVTQSFKAYDGDILSG